MLEGFEPLALQGSMKLFNGRTVAFVHTEFSPVNMNNVAKVSGAEYLHMYIKMGYRIYMEGANSKVVQYGSETATYPMQHVTSDTI